MVAAKLPSDIEIGQLLSAARDSGLPFGDQPAVSSKTGTPEEGSARTAEQRKLTELQVRYIADRAFRWIVAIRRLNTDLAMDKMFGRLGRVQHQDHRSDPYGGLYDDVHFLCIALDHLDTCLKILNSDGHHVGYDDACRSEWAKATRYMAHPIAVMSTFTMERWQALADAEGREINEWLPQNGDRINRGEV